MAVGKFPCNQGRLVLEVKLLTRRSVPAISTDRSWLSPTRYFDLPGANRKLDCWADRPGFFSLNPHCTPYAPEVRLWAR